MRGVHVCLCDTINLSRWDEKYLCFGILSKWPWLAAAATAMAAVSVPVSECVCVCCVFVINLRTASTHSPNHFSQFYFQFDCELNIPHCNFPIPEIGPMLRRAISNIQYTKQCTHDFLHTIFPYDDDDTLVDGGCYSFSFSMPRTVCVCVWWVHMLISLSLSLTHSHSHSHSVCLSSNLKRKTSGNTTMTATTFKWFTFFFLFLFVSA